MSRQPELDPDLAALALRWDKLNQVFPELHPKRRFEAIALVSQVLGMVLNDVTDTTGRGILGGGHNGRKPEEHQWNDEDEAKLAAKQERARRLATRR